MKHVGESLQAYLAGELKARRAAAVAEHLEECQACRLELDQARELWALLGSVNSTSAREDSLWPAVRARTLGGSTDPRAWFFGKGPWRQAGLAGAALAAGLMLGVLMPSSAEKPAQPANGSLESSWLTESSWLSGSSWLDDDQAGSLDDLLLGLDLSNEGNGS